MARLMNAVPALVAVWMISPSSRAADPYPVAAGATIAPAEKSWVLTDGQYDRCLAAATNLVTCKAALDEAVPRCVQELRSLQGPLASCATALATDQARDDQLVQDVLKAQELRAADRILIAKLKAQRNVAYLVIAGAGVVVVGGAYAVAIIP